MLAKKYVKMIMNNWLVVNRRMLLFVHFNFPKVVSFGLGVIGWPQPEGEQLCCRPGAGLGSRALDLITSLYC